MSDALAGVDAVIHSAGLAHGMSGLPEDDYRAINTEATVGLARAAARAGVLDSRRAAPRRALRAGVRRRDRSGVRRSPARAVAPRRGADVLEAGRSGSSRGATHRSRSGVGVSTTRAASPISASCSRSWPYSPSCSPRPSRSSRAGRLPCSSRPSLLRCCAPSSSTLTHWFYLYLPWVVPFVFLWLLLPEPENQDTKTRIDSIDEALPVAASQLTTAPSMRTPP